MYRHKVGPQAIAYLEGQREALQAVLEMESVDGENNWVSPEYRQKTKIELDYVNELLRNWEE